jgi:hypothetical protein
MRRYLATSQDPLANLATLFHAVTLAHCGARSMLAMRRDTPAYVTVPYLRAR